MCRHTLPNERLLQLLPIIIGALTGKVVIPLRMNGFYNLMPTLRCSSAESCHTAPNERLLQLPTHFRCRASYVVIPLRMNGFYNTKAEAEAAYRKVVIPLRMNGFYNMKKSIFTIIAHVVIPLRMNGFYNAMVIAVTMIS